MPSKLNSEDIVGSFFISSSGTDCIVTNYKNSKKVTVRFLDSYEYEGIFTIYALRKGSVFNPYDKNVYGIGFCGSGNHAISEEGNITLAYRCWHGIMRRAYSEKSLKKSPTYQGCTVCEEWHNFQVFAEWYTKQEFYGFGYDLDKDLLSEGGKIYSPETCCLLPKSFNTMIIKKDKKKGAAQGVSFNKKAKKYQVTLGSGGSKKNLGYFIELADAYQTYKKAKEHSVRGLAEKYKNTLCSRSYKALSNWELL